MCFVIFLSSNSDFVFHDKKDVLYVILDHVLD